jgi:hypothetical protein
LHHNWDRWLDTFSALVIYLSLVALARDPGLWLALYNSKNLLFAKTDFFPPFTTEAWKQLAALRDPQVDELARKLQECCNPLWVSNRSLEATLEQPAASALPPVPGGQPWWQQGAAPGAGTPAQGVPAPASPSRPRPQSVPSPGPVASRPAPGPAPAPAAAPPAGPPGGSLPAPPPLSAPLGTAGTGPMPQLSQTMMPPSDTIWWTRPPAGQAQAQAQGQGQGQPGPGYRGLGYQRSAPSAPTPRGYAPHAPVPTPPGPPVPGPAAPATRTQAGPAVGAIALAVGVLLLVIGAASHIGVVVIGGLVLGAWGMWRLVTATGRGSKPPG